MRRRSPPTSSPQLQVQGAALLPEGPSRGTILPLPRPPYFFRRKEATWDFLKPSRW